ncbi:MAG TPA: flagella basal body P-ring formation protein FlgA [Novosphingobium sp.]|nr:flagella basal body P-ring formation protein FlgA [Novosphingobium sp.]
MSASLLLLVAAASPFADLDAIDRQVAAFTGAPAGEAGGAATPVDRRLRLQPCRSGLALSWRTPAQDSVVVQCGDPSGWRLFVPVKAGGAAAGQGGPVAVARGDAVAIAVSGEGFTVSQPGEALESGPVGGWIRVRPAAAAGKSARTDVMRARIERPGLVSVPMP